MARMNAAIHRDEYAPKCHENYTKEAECWKVLGPGKTPIVNVNLYLRHL